MSTIPNFQKIFRDLNHNVSERVYYERKQLVNLALKKGATKTECAKALNLDPALITRLTKSERKEGKV